MSVTAAAIPIQLQATVRSVPPVGLIDVNTGEWPVFFKGSTVAFNVGIFDVSGFSVDLSNLDGLKLEIFPYVFVQNYLGYPIDETFPALLSLDVTELTETITRQQWQAGLTQNASFVASDTDTSVFDLEGQPSKRFTVCLSGTLTTGGARIIYGSGPIFVYESGITRDTPTS